MNKNYEQALPEGYRLVRYINAKDKKFGIIFNLIAIVIFIIIELIAILIVNLKGDLPFVDYQKPFALFITFLLMLVYVVLHELVHGIAYKIMTKQKLTFGISWSCAFCGVPNIFTYRKTALFALVAPFTIFTIILIPINIYLLTIDPTYFLLATLIFGLHFGGCAGDLYMTFLLLTKYKDPNILIKDTGPEQKIFIKESL